MLKAVSISRTGNITGIESHQFNGWITARVTYIALILP